MHNRKNNGYTPLPSLQTQKQSSEITEEHSQLTPTVSNHSETASIPYVFLSISLLILQNSISTISFCSKEFRSIKLIAFAVSGLKTNFPSFSLPDSTTSPSTANPVELNQDEAKEALRHWRQMKFVVSLILGINMKSAAITRITGEEDVHELATADAVEQEISFLNI